MDISDSGHFQRSWPWKVSRPLQPLNESSAPRAAGIVPGSIKRQDDRGPESQHVRADWISRNVSSPGELSAMMETFYTHATQYGRH